MKSELKFVAGFKYPEELRPIVTSLAEKNELSAIVCKMLADKYGIKLSPKEKEPKREKRRRF